MDLADAILALTDIGVLPVITVAATLWLATIVYKRFRK
jgi:hypothetical protein